MSEVIYVLMIAFVGYVVYSVTMDKNGSGEATHYQPDEKIIEVSADTTKPEVVTEVVTIIDNDSDEIKNPKTGEVSKIPNNYRFGKRWIKEALVAEGLLDKVYKNNEVNDAVSEKAHMAMIALKNMDQYRV